MLLHEEILSRLDDPSPLKRLIITPILDREKQIGPGSVDLRLGSEFLEIARQSNSVMDPVGKPMATRAFVEQDRKSYVPLGGAFVLHPGQFVLGSTLEFLGLPPDLGGQVLSRSSWGRLGLLVATAVAVQPGFRGALTLELVNAGSVPIVLRPGLRVAQLQLWSGRPTAFPYSEGKYDAPLGPESNRLALEDDERRVLELIGDEMTARRQDPGDDSPLR